MTLHEFVSRTSILDDFTIKHLRQWAERYAPSAEEPELICAKMTIFLEGLDPEDREAIISQGWTAVFDAAERDSL